MVPELRWREFVFDGTCVPDQKNRNFGIRIEGEVVHIPEQFQPIVAQWRIKSVLAFYSRLQVSPSQFMEVLGWTIEEVRGATEKLRVLLGYEEIVHVGAFGALCPRDARPSTEK